MGDSTEQNVFYKIYLGEANKNLVEMKYDKCLNCAIEKHKIIKLVKTTWNKLFARTLTNRKTIAERGWYPLNQNFLCVA